MVGIYKITNPNDRVYVGQSINIESRWKAYSFINKSKKLTKLYRSFLKYGIVSHKFEIIEECSIESLNERERYWQEHYNTLEEGLNCFLTLTDTKKYIRSKETQEKLTNSIKESFTSGKNKGWIGKKHTEESKKKMSLSKTGKKFTDEINKKKGRKGRVGNRKGMKSELSKINKPIFQFTLEGIFIKEWVCGLDIKREIGLNNTNICSCCKGKQKTSGGYIWKYA